jgi:hypothetical protein
MPLFLFAAAAGLIASTWAPKDFALSADPNSAEWKNAPAVFAINDPLGVAVPGHRTEIRSRWTKDNIYFLFICPYAELYLKPDPVLNAETNKLWNWDVAEVFIGWDFKTITRYKEFEISPRGEWVDLDIDRKHPLPSGGVLWNSGFHSKTRIDEQNKIWYGEMQIPTSSIANGAPSPGQKFRVNLYRMQGPPPKRHEIAWQPTGSMSFHVPEAFGTLELRKR